MFLSKLWKRIKKEPESETDQEKNKEYLDDYDHYDNDDSYHNNDNLDLIRNKENIINHYDNLHNHDKTRSKSLNDIYSLLEKHDSEVKELMKTIPAKTVEDLKTIQKNYPRVFSSLMHKFEKTVKSQVEDLIDKSIMVTVKTQGKVSSLRLLEEITINKNICTQSTLYLHLKKLVNKGLILKKRDGKIVYYSVPTVEIEEIKTQDIQKHYDHYDLP